MSYSFDVEVPKSKKVTENGTNEKGNDEEDEDEDEEKMTMTMKRKIMNIINRWFHLLTL